MRRDTPTLVKAAFATVLGILSVPLAGSTEARAQTPRHPTTPIPSSILPPDLNSEITGFDAKFKPSSLAISQSGKH